MLCPNCSGEVGVMDTISSQQVNYRSRKCNECGFKFYTTEKVCAEEEAKPLFTEWTKERSRKHRAKKKGLIYEPSFTDGREQAVKPKKPTNPLF